MDSNAKQIKFANEAVYKIIFNTMARPKPTEWHNELNKGQADTKEINQQDLYNEISTLQI
jgi:hypothetical protein